MAYKIDGPNTVELLDYSGGDLSHARAAWASTGKEVTWEQRVRIPSLLQFLAENRHGTPFEHSLISFKVKSDIATHIHCLKHRAGVSINSESARYKELNDDSVYIPEDWPDKLQQEAHEHLSESIVKYHTVLQKLVDSGMDRRRAKETARFYLPYAHQISYVMTFNFRSFVHFQNLRSAEDAQVEIQDIARQMLRIVQDLGTFDHSLKAHGLH